MPGDHAPPQGGAMRARFVHRWAFCYVPGEPGYGSLRTFTLDLPPSPLPPPPCSNGVPAPSTRSTLRPGSRVRTRAPTKYDESISKRRRGGAGGRAGWRPGREQTPAGPGRRRSPGPREDARADADGRGPAPRAAGDAKTLAHLDRAPTTLPPPPVMLMGAR